VRGFVKLDLKKIRITTLDTSMNKAVMKKDLSGFDKATTERRRKGRSRTSLCRRHSLYISIGSTRKNQDDEDFFMPSGSLYFDTTEFKIEDRAKAAGESFPVRCSLTTRTNRKFVSKDR